VANSDITNILSDLGGKVIRLIQAQGGGRFFKRLTTSIEEL
jgi:hypothetical protein